MNEQIEGWSLALLLLAMTGCTSFTAPKAFDASDAIRQRSRITGSAAYQDHPETLIGRIVSVKKSTNGTCGVSSRVFDTWTISRTAYTKEPQASPSQKPNVIYQKHVVGSLATNATFPFVSVSGTGDSATELVITDLAASIGGGNLDQDAVDQLIAKPWPADVCARFLIENVVSSLALYKTHTKVSSTSNIVGTAFGIGADVYSSDEEFKPEALIFADLNPLENPSTPQPQPVAPENFKRPSIQLIIPAGAGLREDDQ